MNVTLDNFFEKNILKKNIGKWAWPTTPVARVGEFFPILYTSPVVSATTSNKNFQKIRYRAPYSQFQTDGQTDRRKDTRTL